jgi:hypothetical protein
MFRVRLSGVSLGITVLPPRGGSYKKLTAFSDQLSQKIKPNEPKIFSSELTAES